MAAILSLSTTRSFFGELVARALGATRVEASPLVTDYLVELLDRRVALPEAREAEETTLAEGLLLARLARGRTRLERLRRLGDRALFVSGFFGDSFSRRLVDLDYYGEVGRSAYSDISSTLSGALSEPGLAQLYRELSDRFPQLVDVLAEVSDRSREGRPVGLLRLYDRYLRTGSQRDLQRLIRRGCAPPERLGVRFWQ